MGCHTPTMSYEVIAAGKATARAFTLFFAIRASRMIFLAHHRALGFQSLCTPPVVAAVLASLLSVPVHLVRSITALCFLEPWPLLASADSTGDVLCGRRTSDSTCLAATSADVVP